jgi:hypothetical protein
MEATQINYRRDEALKTVDQKLQELSETSAIDTDIAPVFKSTNTYAPGDMVYYRNKLYVFNVEHTGAWAAADVTATDVTTQMSSLKSGLTNLNTTLENMPMKQWQKTTSGSAGNVTFTFNSSTNRYAGLLFCINNSGVHAIFAVAYKEDTDPIITRLAGSDAVTPSISSDGSITVGLYPWSSAILFASGSFE